MEWPVATSSQFGDFLLFLCVLPTKLAPFHLSIFPFADCSLGFSF